jgi:hypothetical protein
MTTDATEAQAAVQEYLDAQFQEGDIWDDGDATRSAHTWSAEEHGVIMLLPAWFEFFRNVPAENIVSRLSAWEHRRVASGQRRRRAPHRDNPRASPGAALMIAVIYCRKSMAQSRMRLARRGPRLPRAQRPEDDPAPRAPLAGTPARGGGAPREGLTSPASLAHALARSARIHPEQSPRDSKVSESAGRPRSSGG